VLSKQPIYSRLAHGFVGVRFDWEQGNHYKDRIGFILGTGDQLLLTPGGDVIPPPNPAKDGKPARVYGRNGCDTTPAVLDGVMQHFPAAADPRVLKIEWFFWPRFPSKARPGGSYPVPYESAAGYARLPLAVVDGPIPDALRNSDFLRWHVRQFIWVRGKSDGPSRVTIRRVKDGLKAGLPTELATLNPKAMDLKALGESLDAGWLTYMKDRPLVARGYLENEHGGWMSGMADQMSSEEQVIRTRAREGTLLPPGRKAGENPPYVTR
jgi:hypothetical protein